MDTNLLRSTISIFEPFARYLASIAFAASRSSVSPHRDRAFRRVHHHQCDFLVGYRIEKTYDFGKVLLGSVEGGEVFSKGGLAGHGSSVFVSSE
jgi:hypothetical protein